MAKRLVFEGTTPEELQARIDSYFDSVDATKSVVTLKNGDIKIRYDSVASMIGLAIYLGINKEVLYEWLEYRERQGSIDNNTQRQITDVLRAARDRIERTTLDRATSGDYEPKIAGMILGGMGYGYKEEHSPTVRVRIEGGSAQDVEDWSK